LNGKSACHTLDKNATSKKVIVEFDDRYGKVTWSGNNLIDNHSGRSPSRLGSARMAIGSELLTRVNVIEMGAAVMQTRYTLGESPESYNHNLLKSNDVQIWRS
jgi:hypothetical protein